MALTAVKYLCSHVAAQQLYGPGRDRGRYLAAASHRLCPDCQRMNREGEDRIAGLSPLSGTDRQVVWAEAIRREKYSAIEAEIARLRASPQAKEEPAALDAIIAVARVAQNQTSAEWWINHRSDSPQRLIQSAARGT